jgi:hypothetical protein
MDWFLTLFSSLLPFGDGAADLAEQDGRSVIDPNG